MLRQRAVIGMWLLTLLDLMVVVLMYLFSHIVRGLFDTGIAGLEIYFFRFYRGLPIILAVFFVTFYLNNMKLEEFPVDRSEFRVRTFLSFSFGFLLSVFFLYYFKLFTQSRIALIIFYFLTIPALYGVMEIFSQKMAGIKVLTIGDPDKAKEFVERCSYNTFMRVEPVKYFRTERRKELYAELKNFLKVNPVDWVVVLEEGHEEVGDICADLGITVSYPLDILLKHPVYFTTLEKIGEIPIISIHRGSQKHLELFIKYTLDRIFAFIFLIITSPLLVVIPVLIKLTSKGPVIFKQIRVGLNGRKFVFYKFRTMYEGADKMKEKLLDYNEMDMIVFKMKNDPRVTPLGRILRKYSLDELPQLWNVLKGDMSLVGPRPPLPEEVEQYELWQRRRLSMKPGLTCLWQISGRNDIKFNEWINLDLEYIDNWSLSLDLKILLKTIPVVITGKGAY